MDPIIKRLLENHQVNESDEMEDIPAEEEIEEQEEVDTEEEETLEEDWRSGTFDEKDMTRYEKEIMEEMRRWNFSLTNLEKMHPQHKQRFQKLRAEIKRMF